MTVVGAGEAMRLAKALVVGALLLPTLPLALGGVFGRGGAEAFATGRRRGDGAGILDWLFPTVVRGTAGLFPTLAMPLFVVLDLGL